MWQSSCSVNTQKTSLRQGDLLEKFKKNNLKKVTNKEKPPQMFSLACNLTKNDVEFLPIEISSKKIRASNVDFSNIKITSKNVIRGYFEQRNYIEKST